ncbi:MAG: hypothetical protein PHS79_03455 [Patescibacteria group bacterium]|nr:hypothetical protein [Patescibacteria group bacterium]
MELHKMMTLTLEKTAVDSLKRADGFLTEAEDDLLAFKWFIVAIHHALHCLMLAALPVESIWVEKGAVLRDFGGMKLIDNCDPKNHLINFLTAYTRIKDPEKMGIYVHSKYFIGSNKHDEAMKFLNSELRNIVMHFRPMVFAMSSNYIADCKPVIDVIDFLILESGNIIHPPANDPLLKNTTDQIRLKLEEYAGVG